MFILSGFMLPVLRVKSIFPIIDELNTLEKNFKFLITTTTLSSGKIAEIELGHIKNIEHRYFPLDVPFLIKIFLKQWKLIVFFLLTQKYGQIYFSS